MSPGHFASTWARKRLLISKISLQMARENFLEEANAPFFQRLGQKRMIGISKGLCDDGPSFLPG